MRKIKVFSLLTCIFTSFMAIISSFVLFLFSKMPFFEAVNFYPINNKPELLTTGQLITTWSMDLLTYNPNFLSLDLKNVTFDGYIRDTKVLFSALEEMKLKARQKNIFKLIVYSLIDNDINKPNILSECITFGYINIYVQARAKIPVYNGFSIMIENNFSRNISCAKSLTKNIKD